ncbi:hypothetical protein LWI29_015904 [Acer saccharum]|uniref:non-specific serine/threonine protein kinase n=1 Tax=Acer saccharum TaxID=4024 RepID=A0AA39RYR2_ACESA|nr:hypothetical protein LWI29_015904 [Acer saccharum]
MNNNHVFPTLTLHLVITISFFLIVVPVSHCQNDDHQYSNCSIPYPYRCGSSELNISYPFWGGKRPQHCGLGHEGLEIKCHADQYHFIEFENQKFRVLTLSINESHPTMTIAQDDRWNNYCPGNETQETVMLDLEPCLFKYSPNVGNLSFFRCQDIHPQHPGYFKCSEEGEDITGFYTVVPPPYLPATCQELKIKVAVLLTALDDLYRTGNLSKALNKGFEVEYLLDITNCSDCYLSGGRCGFNQSAPGQFLCYCHDHKPQMSTCPHPGMILHILSKYPGLPLCFKAYIILV